MSQATRKASGIMNPDQTLDQTHVTMRNMVTLIKNPDEAKRFLFSKNWILPGEEISLELLARTLFSVVAGEQGKVNVSVANPILAVAYLITSKIEEGLKLNIANSITKHLLDSIIPITTDIQTRLENHLQAVNESNKSHMELAEKLQDAQEKLEVTTEKVNTNVKTYSQVAASMPNPSNPYTSTQTTSHSQLQIRNREEIRGRQVLVSFTRTTDMVLENMDEDTLARKALDAINTVWAVTSEPKPSLPKLKAATLL